jgi:Domain of unknown function (DUF2703)
MSTKLPIVWQRLVTDGETCGRCNATHQEIRQAVGKLAATLQPLDIEPVLTIKEIDQKAFQANPSESNRIWIGDRPFEEWLGAKVASSRCSSVCGDSQCRTVEIEDTIFEAIPQELLIKAALIAASELDSAQISKAFVKNGSGKDSGRH